MTLTSWSSLLEANGFSLVRERGSVRYYRKEGWVRPVRVDYHGSKEVPEEGGGCGGLP